MEIKKVLPSHRDSYEWICHETERTAFLLDLHGGAAESLHAPRLERAIGVVYRPETELASHYMQAVLPRQFDEYVWLDETQAVTPLSTIDLEGTPDTYPFGL